MKINKAVLAVLAAAALTLVSARADQITGDIDFAGQAFFDTPSLATATQVTNFKTMAGFGLDQSALVTDATGSFATTVVAGDIAFFPRNGIVEKASSTRYAMQNTINLIN